MNKQITDDTLLKNTHKPIARHTGTIITANIDIVTILIIHCKVTVNNEINYIYIYIYIYCHT